MANLIIDVPLTSDDPAVTFTRSGDAWYPDADGVYELHTSGVPSYTSEGLYTEPRATNVCTNNNADPSAGLDNVAATGGILSSIPVLFSSSGLQNICPNGHAFQLENNTNLPQTVTISGQVGSTNPSAISLFSRAFAAGCTFQLTGGNGLQTIAKTDKFVRHVSESIIPDAADEFQIIVPAGVKIQWVLNQLESAAAGSAWGVTTPIVVEGVAVLRNAAFASYSLPAGLSDTNILITVDLIAASAQQYNLNASAISADGAVDRFDISVPRVRRVNSEGDIQFASRYVFAGAVQRIGFQWDSGAFAWGDGLKSPEENTTNTTPCDISNSTLRFGVNRLADVTTGFAGRIKNFRFYDNVGDDAEVAALTTIIDHGTPLNNIGLPFYGQDRNIWALLWNPQTLNYDRIGFSVDGGVTFVVWAALDIPGTGGYIVLTRDRAGNCYYGSPTGLRRVTPEGKQGLVITWDTSVPAADFGWRQWAWGQQEDGTLYTAPYNQSLTADVGTAWMYRSINNGNSWEAINVVDLFPGETQVKHIHALRVSPVDDKIYASFGDAGRGTFVSDDLMVGILMSGASFGDGPTDISFDKTGAVFFTDIVGNTNAMDYQSEVTMISQRLTMPFNMQTSPVYNGRVRNSEMTTFSRNEGAAFQSKMLTWDIPYGIEGPVQVTRVISTPDPDVGGVDISQVSVDEFGQVPSWAESVFLGGFSGGQPVVISYDAFQVPAIVNDPELITPYTPVVSRLGDLVDIATQFSGAEGYVAQDLPDGCAIDPNTGRILGTVESPLSGVPQVIAKNDFTTGVSTAIPWDVSFPGISRVAVVSGVVTLDTVAIPNNNPVYLSPFGLLTATVNNGQVGTVDGSGDQLIINGVAINSPTVLFISPDGILTDQPNGDPVANFVAN
jgi:hypothetical protein